MKSQVLPEVGDKSHVANLKSFTIKSQVTVQTNKQIKSEVHPNQVLMRSKGSRITKLNRDLKKSIHIYL